MLRKVLQTKLTKRFKSSIAHFILDSSFLIQMQYGLHNQFPYHYSQRYSFCNQTTPTRSKRLISEVGLTFIIEQAQTPQDLHKIIQNHGQRLNFIHRTLLLQKATQKPFDKDQKLVQSIIYEIKSHWKYDFMVLSQINSRAIANTICYMSRKIKYHDLDQEFAAIDFNELAIHLTDPKQFVMMLNGLLKLRILERVFLNTPRFTLQEFLTKIVTQKFSPSLLVSMWFNIIKYKKSSKTINDFFANFVKNKNFKNNLIDYMQIIYCYVNSEGQRSVDLIYPVMTHPNELKDERGYLGAHELSVLYEQLGKLKKMKDVHFSAEFIYLLEGCFRKILIEKDIPLRNVANVFVNLTQWENPTSNILDDVFYKYYTVLKSQIYLLQSYEASKKFRANVDPLSFVTLFEKLLQYLHPGNIYLNQLTTISLAYVQKIIQKKMISEYNEKTFVRLLSAIKLAKKIQDERYPQKKFQLKKQLKEKLKKQINRRIFNEVISLEQLVGFVYTFDIRQKIICNKFRQMIQSIPVQNQLHGSYQIKLKQSCVLNQNCTNCQNCFSS